MKTMSAVDEDPVPGVALQAATATKGQGRLALRIQFPRRVLLILLAYGLAMLFLSITRQVLVYRLGSELKITDWSVSWISAQPVSTLIAERMPNSLLLVAGALAAALPLAVAAILVATAFHQLEMKYGAAGSVLKGAGRLVVFIQAAAPVFVPGLSLIWILGANLKMLPLSGMTSPGGPGSWEDRLRHLILPALALALFPAMVTAQGVARELTLPRQNGKHAIWLVGIFKTLGAWLGKVGWLLSALVLVEKIFAWPGIGRMAWDAIVRMDLPVFYGILGTMIGLTLAGRLVSELFTWLARLAAGTPAGEATASKSWRKAARFIWTALALVLLLLPLGLALAGLATGNEAVLKSDIQARFAPPSAEHPLGTDELGRDILVRVRRGTAITTGMAVLVAGAVFFPAYLGGGLAGLLARRRSVWPESGADLLLLPPEALALIPAVPAMLLAVTLVKSVASAGVTGWQAACLAAAFVLLPRGVMAFSSLTAADPANWGWLKTVLVGALALFLGSLYTGFGLVAAVDFLGLGVQPPVPSLGSMLAVAQTYMLRSPAGMMAAGGVVWLCGVVFYWAADAMIGIFHSKDAMGWWNA